MRCISVVIPCYNAEGYLGPAIESALQQDCPVPVEVLVGDDGSTDQSIEVAAGFGAAVRVLRHPEGRNRGPSAARNLCIRESKGDFIAFLDADDVFLPGHLGELADALEANPQLGLAYDNGFHTNGAGCIIGPRLPADCIPAVTAERLLLDQCFPPCAVMVRKAVFDRVGLFDESLFGPEDHDMWLRIMEQFEAAYVNRMGYLYRLHEDQMTMVSAARIWREAEKVLDRAMRRHPYPGWAIRKRRAVIAYRHGQAALGRGERGRALAYVCKAGALDPRRAVEELASRLAARSRRRRDRAVATPVATGQLIPERSESA